MVHEIQKDLVQAEKVRVMHAAVDAKLMPGRAEPAIRLQPVHHIRHALIEIGRQGIFDDEVAIVLELFAFGVGQPVLEG